MVHRVRDEDIFEAKRLFGRRWGAVRAVLLLPRGTRGRLITLTAFERAWVLACERHARFAAAPAHPSAFLDTGALG